ncbi:hypothetical protein KVF89_22340 [Nocardioides carbamazepini]|uniref:hypothetical protein n=1 Tax=Nocardioides carbamazepini TaxID=2854259 RepID=UPI00214A2C0F|nr:hypothetical protein [Nocardioides carbamazepini]MCR1785296.1 hypothetical protein [Nocardioides carbamazepini]
MSEASPEQGPVVALLVARRAVLTGGPNSIGVQEARVTELRAGLDEAVAFLAACRAEVVEIDAAIAVLSPPVPDPPIDPEVTP